MELNMFDTLESYMVFANIWIPLTIISKQIFQRILGVAFVDRGAVWNPQITQKPTQTTSKDFVFCVLFSCYIVWWIKSIGFQVSLMKISHQYRWGSYSTRKSIDLQVSSANLNQRRGTSNIFVPFAVSNDRIDIEYSIQTNSCWSHWIGYEYTLRQLKKNVL